MFNTINGGGTACCDITEFAEIVIQNLEEMLGGEYSISVSRPSKNNGITPTGLSIKDNRKRPDAGAIIYLEGYLENYNEGDMDIGEICDDMIKIFHENMRNLDFDFDVNSISLYEEIKGRIRCKLINAEMNSDLLCSLPHRNFRDLAIIYYMQLRVNEQPASITISSRLMELWGVDENELYNTAIENVKHKSDYCILTMSDIMKDTASKLGLSVEDGFCAPPPGIGLEMYVATNTSHEFASNIILNNNMLKEFSDSIHGRDFYILPSSIHELIFIPVTGVDARSLSGMVKDVNTNVLDKEEILSNSVYRYYRDLNKVVVECYG